ncbi:MAG: T9SS type A sorting domain-containing protein [Bacteroidetes bacterium]|nr:T9SS type A sorting domain-containing protein [Bacteroidota bacterium]
MISYYKLYLFSFLFLNTGIIILLSSNVIAQNQQNIKTVHFSYDLTGNREHRWVTVIPMQKFDSIDSIKQDSIIKNYDGLQNHQRITISLFPNPTKGILDLTINGLKEGELVEYWLYSLGGKQLSKSQTTSAGTHIDLSNFIAGIYIITVKTSNSLHKWKIIKEQ